MQIRRCVVAGAVCAVLAAGVTSAEPPQTASESAESKIDQLEQRLDRLMNELAKVKAELRTLKEQAAEEQGRAEMEKLRRAAEMAAAETGAGPDRLDTTRRFHSGTRMQAQLNPELSVTGDMFLYGGDHRHEEMHASDFELDVQSYLDPYTFMHVVLGYHGGGRESWFGHEHDHANDVHGPDEGLELEEGYVTWLQLPGAMSLTVGKKRQQFGVLNRWHLHALDQADLPWVLQESFGEEGLTGTGLSVDWLMPRLWADANELTVEITNGDNEAAFAGEDWEHPTLSARLKSYWDLSTDSYFELGLNAVHGSADPDGLLDHDFYALDMSFNWNPAGRELYHDSTIRAMLLESRIDLPTGESRDAWGGYVYGQHKLSRRWIAGLRYDRVDDQYEAARRWWGLTPYVTFWQSEFVRLRAQASYRKDSEHGTERQYLLQLTVAAGPHKHDTY